MYQEFFPVLDAVPMGDLWVSLILGLILAEAWMLGLWVWNLRRPKVHLADFGWAGSFVLLALLYALKADGYGVRRFLIGSMVILWAGSLAWRRWAECLPWPEEEPVSKPKTLLQFVWGGFAAAFLSFPFALLVMDPLAHLTGYEWLGFIVWLIAMAGQWRAVAAGPVFEWLVWVAYAISCLNTPYGAWAILCPILMLRTLQRARAAQEPVES